MTFLPQIRIIVPSAQVSSYTTGVFSLPSAKQPFTPPVRGLFGGGGTSTGNSNVIDYIDITTLGNATDFGDLVSARSELAGNVSSSTRALFDYNSAGSVFGMDYVTIATEGNATKFGDFGSQMLETAGLSNSTRGLFGGGRISSPYVDISTRIEYVTIASTGNGTSFGDQNVGRRYAAGTASSTRGLFAGGYRNDGSNARNDIEYVTIASTGNGTDFGDLTTDAYGLGAASSGTRAIFAGGNQDSGRRNVIDYVTIATTGNATDFGDLSQSVSGVCATGTTTRAVISIGDNGTSKLNIIEYITFASTGNSVDFGDLTVARGVAAANSAGHGGL